MKTPSKQQRGPGLPGTTGYASEMVGPDTPETQKAHDSFRLLPTCARLERERDALRAALRPMLLNPSSQRVKKLWPGFVERASELLNSSHNR